MERVLITGGAGFIGSALISELNKYGHEIFVIDNLLFGNRLFIKTIDDAHFINTDILDTDLLESNIEKINPSWVIHLAAVHFIPFCNEHPFMSANINIQGTINLLNSCKRLSSLKKVFFASSAAVYAISGNALSEDSKIAATDIYGLTKMAGERLFSEFHLQTQIPVIVCRFFNAFGPNETNPHLIPAIQEQVNNGMKTLKLGNLEPKRDYIHTYDMAKAIKLLLDKFEKGYEVFNLGSGIEYSVYEIVNAFEDNLGEKLRIEQDPLKIRKSDRMHLLADISKLTAYISWEPKINLSQGIQTLINKRITV